MRKEKRVKDKRDDRRENNKERRRRKKWTILKGKNFSSWV
jgi:hypothetical protein